MKIKIAILLGILLLGLVCWFRINGLCKSATIAGSGLEWQLFSRPVINKSNNTYIGTKTMSLYKTTYFLGAKITMGDRDYLQHRNSYIDYTHPMLKVGFTIVETEQQHLTLHVVPEGGLYPIHHQFIYVSNNLNNVMVEINTSTWPAGSYVITLDPEKTGKFSQWYVKRYNLISGCPGVRMACYMYNPTEMKYQTPSSLYTCIGL